MKFDIYFHDDFDGRASAAILLNFLRTRGDDIEKFVPVNFHLLKKWAGMSFGKHSIIVDFLYHPRATMWFDHHPTTFLRSEWQKKFRPDKFHVWNDRHLSCSSLVLNQLVKDFKFRPPAHLQELAKWLDVIDAAKFKSAKQTIEIKEPALQIEHFIDEKGGVSEPLQWLIEAMSKKSLRSISGGSKIRNFMKVLYRKRDAALRFSKTYLQIFDHVGFLDISGEDLLDLRFAPYYLEPRLKYFMFLRKHPGEYGVHVGANPWLKKETQIHLGELLRNRFGGGGHKNVGAARFKTKREAKKAAYALIDFLKTK